MMSRPRPRLLLLVLALSLLVTACGERNGDDLTGAPSPDPTPSAPPDDAGGPATPEATVPPADPQAPTREVDVWYARQGDAGVTLEPERIRLDDDTVEVLRAAVEALVQGQSANPALTSLAPTGVQVLGVAIEDSVAVVDVSSDVMEGRAGSSQELAFAQQLAHTATQFDTVDAVRLLVEGQAIQDLWGHVDWSQPITADPALLSPIIIEDPAWGTVRDAGVVTASGTSVTFESTVELHLVDPEGTVVEETFTTAAQPDVGQRGPWTHTFDTAATAPGTWTIEAVEPDPSGGEGRPPFTTAVEFTVS